MVLNIVGLTISVPEFIWTIISFFLLMFLLNKFLYKPVIKFMDEREKRIAAGLQEGREAQKTLEENEEALKAELADTGSRAREIIAEARANADKAKGETLDEAHKEAERLHRDVRERVKSAEESQRSTVEQSMPELVAVLTDRLLGGGEASGEKTLIDECVAASKEE